MKLQMTLLCFVGLAARPDIAPDPVQRLGESLAPRSPTAIEMSSETVRLALDEDTARVEAVFTLHNTSSNSEDLDVGFPTAAQPANYSWSSREGLKVTEWGPSTIRDFSARVDGREVKAEPKTSPNSQSVRGWLCWPMAFGGGQTHTVEVRYEVATRDDAYSDPSPLLNRQMTYILKTGAGWKGPIGEAVVILDLSKIPGENISRAAPEPTRKDPGSWTWRFKDFKPSADVLIQYRVYTTAQVAVEKLSTRLKSHSADVEGWIDLADNCVALGRPLEAARAFARLDELEKVEKRPLFRARTEYQPPAYRAARAFREAEHAEESREWAKRAATRLEELDRTVQEIMLRKMLHTSRETIRKCLAECRDWTAGS